MSTLQFVAATTGTLAWPAVIIFVAWLVSRDIDHISTDAAIVTLPASTREILREPGTEVVVYPTDLKTGQPRLDKPLRHRDIVGFDKRHPQWDRQVAR